MRFVSRSFPLDPVAVLPGKVRNRSRLTGLAPFDTKYALRNVKWVNSSSVLSWMYTSMSSSSTFRASVKAGFPVPPGTSLSWNSREFVVLDPEIGLEDFRGGCEPEQSGIAGCDSVHSRPHRQTLLKLSLTVRLPEQARPRPVPCGEEKIAAGECVGVAKDWHLEVAVDFQRYS